MERHDGKAIEVSRIVGNVALSRAYCYRYCYRSTRGVRNWRETSRFRRGRLINGAKRPRGAECTRTGVGEATARGVNFELSATERAYPAIPR